MPRGRPSRKQVYSALDRALDDLWAVGGLPLPLEAEGIWEGIWHEETHHSTAIEGNTLVLRQVRLLLEEGRAVGDKELREYLEIQGYAEAAKWVYAQAIRRAWGAPDETEQPINLNELREIHRLVIEPVWTHFPPVHLPETEKAGSFRQCEIEPFKSGRIPPVHTDVQPQIADWLRATSSPPQDGVHMIEHLASLHAAFERIHPFRDGNGRVGRLALNLLLVRHGAPPAIIYKRDRPTYLRALERADQEDSGLLGELFARAVRHGIERFLLPALAGPHRLVPLGSLATKEMSHVALLKAAKRDRLRAVRYSDQWYSNRKWVNEYRDSRQHRGKAA